MWDKIYSPTGYLYSTRSTSYGLFLLLPLVVIYEILTITLDIANQLDIRNLAEEILREPIEKFGFHAPPVFAIAFVLSLLLALYLRKEKSAPFKVRFYLGAILESAFYASFIGIIAAELAGGLLAEIFIPPIRQVQIMLSFGAGVYEELIFRVLLFKFTAEGLIRIVRMNQLSAYILAAIFSSILFSYAHFLGPETVAIYPFMFRFILGLFFCLIFWTRGLGVVAWTHTLYDLFLIINS